MKKTIFTKVFCAFLLLIGLLSTVILLYSFNTIRSHYIDTLTNDLQHLAATLRLKVNPLFSKKHFDELDSLVKQLGKEINTRITVIDYEGVVVADSEKDPNMMENHKFRPEILQVLQGELGTSLRFSTTVKEEMLYVALPLEEKGKTTGVLRVSLFLRDINSLINSLKKNIFFSALIIALISLLGALIFSRSLSKPISELNAASHRLATGDFNVRVFLKNRDEIKELGDSFNYMVEKIKELFTELSLKKEQLNSIISSVQEGLLVFDKNGKIILSNESFKKIIRENAIEDKFYWEAVRVPQFADLIKKVTEEGKSYIAEELPLQDKFFICSVTFLESREETVVIFYDITEMKNVEKIKKDFVVNVSHELRTPLTAIKGFVETLEESVEEENKNFVEIIKRNTDRLINIVEDLLVLSELEEKGTSLELEDLQLKEMVERILTIFEHRIEEKGLTLVLHVENAIPPIMADAFKLEQALINLIDNAVKYTEKGTIALSLRHVDNKVMIEIKDTGIGIPEEHIPRIFERFYVVDKSRSKRLGGTGLGLSIVKHIVLLHNGTLQVKSSPSQGTTFSITLPTNHV